MLVESLGGCLPVEGLARSAVEGGGDGVQVLRGPAGQVDAFRVPLCLSSGWLGRRRVVVGESGK